MPGFIASRLGDILALGGPVVLLLVGMSVLTLAVTLWKLWQFHALRVGRHGRLRAALGAWDRGDRVAAMAEAGRSRSHLAPVLSAGLAAIDGGDRPAVVSPRLHAEAGARLVRLEGGFRVLDGIAQLAPLLGLFGTVLGMIDAFRAMQDAGRSVDPTILAGGIWVALLTTAVGLAVAMPTSVILSWFEARVARERGMAATALQVVLSPGIAVPREVPRAA